MKMTYEEIIAAWLIFLKISFAIKNTMPAKIRETTMGIRTDSSVYSFMFFE